MAKPGLHILILLFLAASLAAQTASSRLHGQVADPTGAVIPGAQVHVKSRAGHVVSVESDAVGVYIAQNLPPGTYTVSVSSQGFRTSVRQIVLAAGQDRQLDFSLVIAVQEKSIVVEENSNAPDASNPAANVSGLVLKGSDLDALPDDPAALETELQSLAGPAAGPAGGQIYIDGFTGGRLPPKSSIREIRINQNPFAAEYDKLGYGRIEIFTKSGTSDIHGRFLFENSDSFLNARNPFLTQDPNNRTANFYGTVSGPINKKASYSFAAIREDISNVQAVSAVGLDAQLNPVALNQAVPNPETMTVINPRVDYQLTRNNNLSLRYQFTDDERKGVGAGQFALASQAYGVSKTEHDLQLSDSQLISSRVVTEFRLQYRRDRNTQTPVSTLPQVTVLGAFTGGGSNLGLIEIRQDHIEVHNYWSLSQGKHFIRLGGRSRTTFESDSSTQNFNGTFTFASLQSYQITQAGLQQGLSPAQIRVNGGGATQFSIIDGQPHVANTLSDVGVFAQDDWRIRPNITFSYGLRYETQNEIGDHADWAPRLSLAWGLGQVKKGATPKTVLRLGAGTFFDRFAQPQTLQALRQNGVNTQQFLVPNPDFFPVVPAPSALASSAQPTVYQIDRKLRAPIIDQVAVALERKFNRTSSGSLTWLYSRGFNQLLSRNINTPLPGTYDPANPASGVRPLGNVGNVYQFQSRGRFNQKQLTATFKTNIASTLTLQGYYALSYADSNTAGPGSFPANPFDLNAVYGRAAFDIRHRFYVNGGLELPLRMRLNTGVQAASGRPFDITVGQDLNGDSILNDRPAFASVMRPSVVATRLGAFDTAPLPGATIVPPNYGNGPAQVFVIARLSKSILLGQKLDQKAVARPTHSGGDKEKSATLSANERPPRQYNLRFDVVAQNLLNRSNFAAPIGNLGSPRFGQSNALNHSQLGANRFVDLQVQLIF